MHFGGNKASFFYAGDFIAVGHDLAAELVSGNKRRMNAVLRPAVPVVDMQVGAADRGDVYFDQHVAAPETGTLTSRISAPGVASGLTTASIVSGMSVVLVGGQKTFTTEVTEDTEDSSTRSAPSVCHWLEDT